MHERDSFRIVHLMDALHFVIGVKWIPRIVEKIHFRRVMASFAFSCGHAGLNSRACALRYLNLFSLPMSMPALFVLFSFWHVIVPS